MVTWKSDFEVRSIHQEEPGFLLVELGAVGWALEKGE
jgi:hypothetical protein